MPKKSEVLGITPKVTNQEKLEVEKYDFCFNLLTNKEGTRIAVGDVQCSPEIFASKEDAKAYIDKKPWALIIPAAGIAYEIVNRKK